MTKIGNKSKLTIIILVAILIFAFVLRIYHLASSEMWFDETISSLIAKQILLHGFPIYESGFAIKSTLLFHYLMAFSLLLFKSNIGPRLVSVFAGLGSVIIAFFIGKEFDKNKKEDKYKSNLPIAGLVASLLTAVLYFEVLYSRQARFYQLFQLLFFLTLFFTYKSRYSKKYAWLATISLILTLDTHIEGLVLIPFLLFIFYYEYKDWKLMIIPIIAAFWYGRTFFYLPIGSTSLATSYAETYASSLYYRLRALVFISLIGIPFAYKANKKLTLLLVLPTIITLIGLVFLKVFAIRYAYFSIFLVIIFISVLLTFIYKQSRTLFTIVLIVMIAWPSNIFFNTGYLTVIKPQEISMGQTTEPVIGYLSLNQSTKQIIMQSNIVTLASPGVEWYFKKPSFVIPFSLNGLSSGFEIYNNKDTYTGSPLFNLTSPQLNNFVLLQDLFGYIKLDSNSRINLDNITNICTLVEEENTIKVYSC